jgi:predicted membrane-bound dolichyl-phosphate-mannose-protein mannosyltransferase
MRAGYFKKEYIIVAFFLMMFFSMSVRSIVLKSITFDELVYIPAGYSYITAYDYRMNPEHPPLMKIIAAAPLLFLSPTLPKDASWVNGDQWNFGMQFLYVKNENTDQLMFWARMPMILIGALLGVYVFLFARDMYGLGAGYVALALYSFSPNILAHTRLATTDIGVTCFSFISIYYFWKYLGRAFPTSE